MPEGKHTSAKWKCEQAIDHNVQPPRLRWLVISSDDSGEGIITILDDYETAASIVRDHNSYDQKTIDALVNACEAIVSAADDGSYQHALHKAEAALALMKEE